MELYHKIPESEHFEDAIRKAISIGGDSDTIASMTGAIAHAYYGKIPAEIWSAVEIKLDWKFKEVIKLFSEKFGVDLIK
jgi:ADP-ribosylglycohydrolase